MPKTRSSDGHEQAPRLRARLNYRPMLPYLGGVVLMVIAIAIAGRQIAHHIDAIELWIVNLGPWSISAFIVLYILATSLLIPETVLAIIAGALFGLLWGFAIVAAASILAAILQFVLARHVLRAHIQRFVAARPVLAAIQRAVQRDALRLQLLLRLTPLNPAIFSYLVGAVGVRFSSFMLACPVLSLHWFIEVYFGRAGKHIARMAGRHSLAVSVDDLILIGGFVVTGIVIWFVSRMAHKAVMEAVAKSVTDPAAAQK